MALILKYYSDLEAHQDQVQNIWPPVARKVTYQLCLIREDLALMFRTLTPQRYLSQGIQIERGFLFFKTERDAMNAPIQPGIIIPEPHVFMVYVDVTKIRSVRNQYQALSDFTIRPDSIIQYMRKTGSNWMIFLNHNARLF